MTLRPMFSLVAATLQLGATLHFGAAFAVPLSAQTKAVSRTQQSSSGSIRGTWRVTVGRVAPWAQADSARLDTKEWIGRSIRFESARVVGPKVLTCANARYQATSVPAEGLFQGGIAAPAENAAKALGIASFPVPGTSLTCDTGIFEFHRADANTLLMAMDNVIWTLDRSAGATAAATSPSGVVQRFLEAHFAGDMGFDSSSLAARRQWLAASLRSSAARYFAQPVSNDEAPALDGDPFTDSQEYPTRFSVGVATVNAKGVASVPVRFADGYSTKSVTYVLRRSGAWLITDVRYSHGPTLMTTLATPPAK